MRVPIYFIYICIYVCVSVFNELPCQCILVVLLHILLLEFCFHEESAVGTIIQYVNTYCHPYHPYHAV